MRQFHFEYQDLKKLKIELAKIKRYCSHHKEYKPVFQIYTSEVEYSKLNEILDCINDEMPDAFYYGCLSCGNILDGEHKGQGTIIACAIFEFETTKYKVVQISSSDSNCEDKFKELEEYCNSNSWVKSIEILTTAKMLNSGLLEKCSENLREDIHAVGGCASNPIDEHSDDTYVFSKIYGKSDDSAIFFLLGGEDLNVYSKFVLGYEPLGSVYKPTSVEGNIIHELNGQPAFDVYRRYLKINNNEHFFFNTLGFPMIMTDNGIDYLKVPIQVLEDESLVMSAPVSPNSLIRLSYGNPSIMLRNIDKIGDGLAEFGPEAIRIFSCFTRKMYWGDEDVSNETKHLADVAPTSGFYTKGELLRLAKPISLLNATLVVIGLREGDAVPLEYHSIINKEQSGVVSYEERLINYIYEATKELENLSITDGMTQLYNRTEIQRQIKEAITDSKAKHTALALVMLDIDNFKKINDNYGHNEGDKVIRGLSSIMLSHKRDNCSVGRWGGEEFMILITAKSEKDVISFADGLRQDFEKLKFNMPESQSVSVGVTMFKPEDTLDSLCIRVDNALYNAKSNGKNRVELL